MSSLKYALLTISCLMFSCVSAQQELESELISKMDDQVNAWNRGDIDSYMKHYWKSDSLVFIGGSGPQYGWLPTLERYKKAYPDRSTMGLLSFEMLRFEALSKMRPLLVGNGICREKWGILAAITVCFGRRSMEVGGSSMIILHQ